MECRTDSENGVLNITYEYIPRIVPSIFRSCTCCLCISLFGLQRDTRHSNGGSVIPYSCTAYPMYIQCVQKKKTVKIHLPSAGFLLDLRNWRFVHQNLKFDRVE